MLLRLITRGNFLRSLRHLAYTSPFNSIPKFTNFPKVFFFSLSYPLSKDAAKDMEDFDLKLKEACKQGEAAIKELMNFLKTNILEISKAYKDNLKKQIEIIDVATKGGSESRKWDDLPQFRTQSVDLNEQLNVFVTTVNILGQLAHNKALQFVMQHQKQGEILAKLHKELKEILKTQLQEIKKLEDELLRKKRDSILNKF